MQGKLSCFCFICIEGVAIAQNIRWENFRGSLKICKNWEGFSRVAFVIYIHALARTHTHTHTQSHTNAHMQHVM